VIASAFAVLMVAALAAPASLVAQPFRAAPVVAQPFRAAAAVAQPFRAAAAVAQPFRAADAQTLDCREWTECRALALEAAARQEYETFHDLAWRAVQLGPKQDAALLFLLARAQSLSGRPLDALVMLRRLATTGVARAAIDDPDFERVRRLRGWPEVEALLVESSEKSELPGKAEKPEKTEKTEKAEKAEKAGKAEKTEKTESPEKAESREKAEPLVAEALTFAAASYKPAALAYDAVSRRFIISDTDVSRLAVIDEFSHHLATLASGQSAGFGTVTALAIDPRAGDLWVASVDGSSGQDVPALHKLQLISGRVLTQFAVPEATTGRLADVAVARDGTVFAIQSGGTILRLKPGSPALDVVAELTGERLASVSSTADGAIYVAGVKGVHRVRQGRATLLTAPDGADLTGLAVIRWNRGSLLALQSTADGGYRAIRARLARAGGSIAAIDVLDPSIRTPNPAAATIVADAFYYVAETGGRDLAIRKIQLR
jgi:hypothetical protein